MFWLTVSSALASNTIDSSNNHQDLAGVWFGVALTLSFRLIGLSPIDMCSFSKLDVLDR